MYIYIYRHEDKGEKSRGGIYKVYRTIYTLIKRHITICTYIKDTFDLSKNKLGVVDSI